MSAGFPDGPRGRRLLLELLTRDDEALAQALRRAASAFDPSQGIARVVFRPGGRREPDPVTPSAGDIAAMLDEVVEIRPDAEDWAFAFDCSVSHARYWQEPDGHDALAATPEVRGALARLAEAIEAPAWWSTPFDPARQALVDWDWDSERPAAPVVPMLTGWADRVRAVESRAAAERPADPAANWSGDWWSTPVFAARSTARVLPETGPVGLSLVEDSLGWTGATVHPVEPAAGLRVLEIAAAEDWAAICRRHPLEVTASRRHDWFRTTGRGEGRWLIPDWEAVAADWDAVHLTPAAYLAAAGTAIEVDADAASVIAGWDPDATYWLGRAPVPRGDAEHWSRPGNDWVWRRDR